MHLHACISPLLAASKLAMGWFGQPADFCRNAQLWTISWYWGSKIIDFLYIHEGSINIMTKFHFILSVMYIILYWHVDSLQDHDLSNFDVSRTIQDVQHPRGPARAMIATKYDIHFILSLLLGPVGTSCYILFVYITTILHDETFDTWFV